LSSETIIKKFQSLAERVLPIAKVAELRDKTLAAATLTDVRALTSCLRP
jgi:hypothetical protein